MTLNARWLLAALATVLLAQTLPAHAQSPTPLDAVRDRAFIEEIQSQFSHPAVRLTLEARRDEAGQLNETEILELDGQWRAERESDDQPLITAVLAAPLSNYLLQIQAGSLGLYSEIFVMDVNASTRARAPSPATTGRVTKRSSRRPMTSHRTPSSSTSRSSTTPPAHGGSS